MTVLAKPEVIYRQIDEGKVGLGAVDENEGKYERR
jgi:hypothetical protein